MDWMEIQNLKVRCLHLAAVFGWNSAKGQYWWDHYEKLYAWQQRKFPQGNEHEHN
jgi:hypothetical protein